MKASEDSGCIIPIIIVLIAVFSLVVTFFVMKPIGHWLLVKHYGEERVESEQLTIVKTKPYLEVSNGDILDMEGAQYLLYSALILFGQIGAYILILNKITKGWVFSAIKNIKKVL